MSAVDVPALLLAIAVSAAITAVLWFFAQTGNRRRDWLVAGIVALALFAIGFTDIARETPRETHIATVIIGALLPSASAMGVMHATWRLNRWLRWALVFVTAFVLLLGGLLLGASIVPRFLGA